MSGRNLCNRWFDHRADVTLASLGGRLDLASRCGPGPTSRSGTHWTRPIWFRRFAFLRVTTADQCLPQARAWCPYAERPGRRSSRAGPPPSSPPLLRTPVAAPGDTIAYVVDALLPCTGSPGARLLPEPNHPPKTPPTHSSTRTPDVTKPLTLAPHRIPAGTALARCVMTAPRARHNLASSRSAGSPARPVRRWHRLGLGPPRLGHKRSTPSHLSGERSPRSTSPAAFTWAWPPVGTCGHGRRRDAWQAALKCSEGLPATSPSLWRVLLPIAGVWRGAASSSSAQLGACCAGRGRPALSFPC